MSFGEAVATGFRKYVDFRGYASRSEYWWWTLFVILVAFAVGIVDGVLNTRLLAVLWDLAVLLPGLAVLVRRLRDAGYHWAWVFIALVPLAGAIVLLVFLCTPTRGRLQQPLAADYARGRI